MRVNEVFIEMNSWRLEVGRFEKETESVLRMNFSGI
jgi:hypothetical protein